ncbi:Asp-tRNA(Asn)/Glu-tRNA(Gln) amidotransferase subunit GatC [Patescibacteria group bacterium]|nr:Asp-tRNA(Asn)/Glu-tRNA(Gln) amidotransferase subunit GatC [Patescibacteria group bacterium]MBU2036154.1 Asp-tRNA(Asn)/Glu-tRNA(Gln) amidotransferase subunit GatC [Patescibacteria group bacterium]
MTNITKQQIIHIAKLAKLKVSEKEIAKFQEQLSNIIEYVSELDKADTKNVKPISQITGLLDTKREDLINKKDCLTLEEALSGTENTHNGYFKVSAILEK